MRIVLCALVAAIAGCNDEAEPDAPTPTPTPTPTPEETGEPEAFSPVAFSIENRRDAPIYVTTTSECPFEPVSVRSPEGERIRTTFDQSPSCDRVREGDCIYPGACPGFRLRRLEPGAQLEATWSKTRVDTRTLDDDDVGAGCGPRCVTRVPVAPGTYTAQVQAYSSCDDCDCSGDTCGRGSSSEPGEPDLAVAVDVEAPGTTERTLAFE